MNIVKMNMLIKLQSVEKTKMPVADLIAKTVGLNIMKVYQIMKWKNSG
jgi:hypothetical protein